MILMPCSMNHGPAPPVGAEDQHEDESGDHRRHRKRQVDERRQQLFAAKFELGYGPCGGDAEGHVRNH
jgi:hypothetical protein